MRLLIIFVFVIFFERISTQRAVIIEFDTKITGDCEIGSTIETLTLNGKDFNKNFKSDSNGKIIAIENVDVGMDKDLNLKTSWKSLEGHVCEGSANLLFSGKKEGFQLSPDTDFHVSIPSITTVEQVDSTTSEGTTASTEKPSITPTPQNKISFGYVYIPKAKEQKCTKNGGAVAFAVVEALIIVGLVAFLLFKFCFQPRRNTFGGSTYPANAYYDNTAERAENIDRYRRPQTTQDINLDSYSYSINQNSNANAGEQRY